MKKSPDEVKMWELVNVVLPSDREREPDDQINFFDTLPDLQVNRVFTRDRTPPEVSNDGIHTPE